MKQALVAVCALAACTRGAEPRSFPLPSAEEARAIAVAEHFVLEGGYTDVIPDPRGIRPEFLEGGLPPSVLWELHHDTLRAKAYGISAEVGDGQPGWTVFFELTADDAELRGVEMSADLKGVRLSHYELRLDSPTKIMRARTAAAGRGTRGRRTRG